MLCRLVGHKVHVSCWWYGVATAECKRCGRKQLVYEAQALPAWMTATPLLPSIACYLFGHDDQWTPSPLLLLLEAKCTRCGNVYKRLTYRRAAHLGIIHAPL